MTHSPRHATGALRESIENLERMANVLSSLDPSLASFAVELTVLVMEFKAEQKRSRILAAALNRYGRHRDHDTAQVDERPCESIQNGPDTCDCGLDPVFHVAKYVAYDPALNYFMGHPEMANLPRKDD